MLSKILLVIRLLLPFFISIILFAIIYYKTEDTSFRIVNSLFYVGIIDIIYGLCSLVIFRRDQHSFLGDERTKPVNIAFYERHYNNRYDEEESQYHNNPITSSKINFIYILIGILLTISSVII